MRGDPLQTLKNINSTNWQNLGEILTVFRIKYVKPQSMAAAKTQISTDSLQSGDPEVRWFLGRSPEVGRRCFRNWCPTDHWTIHIRQDASTPEEINKPGVLGERYVWTNCDTPRKGIRAKLFESSWWTLDEHCDAKITSWCNKDSAGNKKSDANNANNPKNNKTTESLQLSVHTVGHAARV